MSGLRYTPEVQPRDAQRAQRDALERLDVSPGAGQTLARLPFGPGDASAGTENELATAVIGQAGDVEQARDIEALNGGAGLRQWLAGHCDRAWEHSHVRLPRLLLAAATAQRVEREIGARGDRDAFMRGDMLHLPASYVLRLALTDALERVPGVPPAIRATGERLLACFTNDNTAPEVLSAWIARDGRGASLGHVVGDENALRFLLVQLLGEYANRELGLAEHGQKLQVYAAPTPPARLKSLARLLPVEHYRGLLMNPCLSGFADGERKHTYMHLCHETLGHSRRGARGRVLQAGLGGPWRVTPLPCDTSLLNNGTHVSLGSFALGARLAAGAPAADEKYLGDLVSKIVEHFLPLSVGTLSAAPWRLSGSDMRPERALGFLPQELRAEHLRLTWAAWRRKSGLRGALRGDFVPDQRLLDYFAALPSTVSNGAHDGRCGNDARLKAELDAAGVFDRRMSFYTLYRLRAHAQMGFSGFEGRTYSLFPSLTRDLAAAVDLQRLVTAYAYRLVSQGRCTHADIPDDPATESERRQIFFNVAIGLPFFYVRRDTRNGLLHGLLAGIDALRVSKRYPDYFKVEVGAYRAALVRQLAGDGGDVVDALGLEDVLYDLRLRLTEPGHSAAGRLERAIAGRLGAAGALDCEADDFNAAAEGYYRDDLRRQHRDEGLRVAQRLVGRQVGANSEDVRAMLGRPGSDPAQRLAALGAALATGCLAPGELREAIALLITLIHQEQ